jgi:hypothetical protein
LFNLLTVLFVALAAFAVGFVYSSFFEWALHRYLMHSDHLLKYPFRAHQLEHHHIYKADSTYFLGPDHTKKDEEHLTFAWWNAPLLFALHAPLFAAGWFIAGWPAAAGLAASMAFYYAMYEYLHYCMHVPGNRAFERTRMFDFIQLHHRLHHVYYLKNLNVVFPIADFALGTRVALRDPNLFEKLEQARLNKLERTRAREAEEQDDPAAEPVSAAPAEIAV